jgi:predicted transcriptional regulator
MDALWAAGTTLTAKDIVDALGDRALAVTTVLTVLSRLEAKGVVVRDRVGRAHTYRAAAGREDYIAALMREALGSTDDTAAALTRFVRAASPAEAQALRKALRRR